MLHNLVRFSNVILSKGWISTYIRSKRISIFVNVVFCDLSYTTCLTRRYKMILRTILKLNRFVTPSENFYVLINAIFCPDFVIKSWDHEQYHFTSLFARVSYQLDCIILYCIWSNSCSDCYKAFLIHSACMTLSCVFCLMCAFTFSLISFSFTV